MQIPTVVEPRRIICDLDDTLIKTSFRYHQPMWRCGSIVTQALGSYSPHPERILSRHHELDVAMVTSHGFGPERFAKSWVALYHQLADELKIDVRRSVERRLRVAANQYLVGRHETYPRVKRTLQRLRGDAHSLHLVSLGDRALQQRKIRETNLASYFETVTIVPQHKDDAIAKVANGDSRTMMVGDSKKSDILPAINLGIVPVLINRHTWDFSEAPLPEGKYHTINRFEELPELLFRIDNPSRSHSHTTSV